MTSPSDTAITDHIQATITGRVGHIHLNRPEKINALTPEMITAIAAALRDWETDDAVTAVLIDGAGSRGLCAGGDIAGMYDGIRGAAPFPDGFWIAEYAMNLAIAQYPKPVVAVMDGITFGGGVGVAGHAAIRIVTETSQLAMPETAIGLSPDVGGLYLLAHAPGELGTHCALTGARLGPAAALDAGLADYFVPRDRLPQLRQALAEAASAGAALSGAADSGAADSGAAKPGADIAAAVASVARQPEIPANESANTEWIDECYVGDDPLVIRDALRAHADPAAQQAASTLDEMSPTAVFVALRALRNAKSMTLAQVLEQDLHLSVSSARHPDLLEGIRARVIDKDRNPSWQPPTLDDVDPRDIDALFAST